MKHLSDFRQPLDEAIKIKPQIKPKAKDKTGAAAKIKEEKPSIDNLSILKNIVVKNKTDIIMFADGSELDVEPPEANAIVSLYTRLTKENKNKILVLLTKGVSTFMRLTKFALSNG